MADRIKVSTEKLIRNAQELIQIQNGILDVESILSRVYLPKDTGDNIHLSMHDRLNSGALISCDNVTTALQSLCQALKHVESDAQKITAAVLRTAELFDEAEAQVSNTSQRKASQMGDASTGRIVADVITNTTASLPKPIKEFIEKIKERLNNINLYHDIRNLFTDSRFDKTAWENATIEERKAMLCALIPEINRIFKTDVREDIEFFDAKPVEDSIPPEMYPLIDERYHYQEELDYWENYDPFPVYEGPDKGEEYEKYKKAREEFEKERKQKCDELRAKIDELNRKIYVSAIVEHGHYSDSNRQVAISNQAVEQMSYEEVMEVLVHEMRHAYQHEVIRNPEDYPVSEKTVEKWRDNFEEGNYIDPRADKKYNYNDYRNQPVEVDAFSFSENVASEEPKFPPG